MRELTGKQREVLGFMRSFVAKHGVPPTVREIGDQFKVTPRAAFDHLRALERKGALQRRGSAGRTPRALTLTDPPARAPYAGPILRRGAAGAAPRPRGERAGAGRTPPPPPPRPRRGLF